MTVEFKTHDLPDLNSYINAERSNRFKAAKLKKTATESIALQVALNGYRLPDEQPFPLNLDCSWHVKSNRLDPDNIYFKIKFILDGLVQSKFIEGDGRKFVSGIKNSIFTCKGPERVVITIE